VSDYLTDEEQLARMRSWWEENGTSTIVGVVLVILGFVGWRWYDSTREATILQASDLYQEFLDSEGPAREAAAAKLASEAADTAYNALTLMQLAREAVTAGDYDGAERDLVQAIEAAPEPELADIARLRLASVQQQGDRSDAALQTLGAIRGSGFRSLVAELKGDIQLTQGDRSLAHESYVAALADAGDDRRPILEIKAADTAAAETVPLADVEQQPGPDDIPAATSGSVDELEPAAAPDEPASLQPPVPNATDPLEAPDA